MTKCDIGVTDGKTGLYYGGMYTTNITSLDMNILVFTERQSEMKLLMNISNIDICYVFNDAKTSAPMVRLVKDLLSSGGNLPKKCPVEGGYKFEFKDLNADPKFFPFLPDMKFLMTLNFALNNVHRSFIVNVTGEIAGLKRG